MNTVDIGYFPIQLRKIEAARRERALTQVEDVIEVRPEIMQLLDAFDAPVKNSSRGSSRALCMLKKNAKKRRRQESEGPSTD